MNAPEETGAAQLAALSKTIQQAFGDMSAALGSIGRDGAAKISDIIAQLDEPRPSAVERMFAVQRQLGDDQPGTYGAWTDMPAASELEQAARIMAQGTLLSYDEARAQIADGLERAPALTSEFVRELNAVLADVVAEESDQGTVYFEQVGKRDPARTEARDLARERRAAARQGWDGRNGTLPRAARSAGVQQHARASTGSFRGRTNRA
jgi:hypothetical protein